MAKEAGRISYENDAKQLSTLENMAKVALLKGS